MKIRIVMASMAFLELLMACSAPEPERAGRSEQRVTAEDEDGGISVDDASAPDATTEDAGPVCAHPICAPGGPLEATCDSCATRLCAQDPYCCSSAWDETCVGEVASICGQSCTAPTPDAGPSTCTHPICATGGPLVATCDPCATALCAQDPYCCGVSWDATCVGEVKSICGLLCK